MKNRSSFFVLALFMAGLAFGGAQIVLRLNDAQVVLKCNVDGLLKGEGLLLGVTGRAVEKEKRGRQGR